jgi:hypothetical protein
MNELSTTLPAPMPEINPETKPFWEGCAQGKLLLKRCKDCGEVHYYPRAICPFCMSDKTAWFESTGQGSIYTFTITRRAGGDYAKAAPYVLAYVTLDEGPTMLSNIVTPSPETLAIDQRVKVVFHPAGDGAALPRFEPA